MTNQYRKMIRPVISFAKHHIPHLISAGLLLMMAVNLLTVTARKSITIDETLIIPDGYYFVTTGNVQITHDHPPFAAMTAALPLLFLPLQTPSLDDVASQPSLQQSVPAGARFWAVNREHFRAIFFWSRVPMILLTVLLGVLIFVFTKRLFGARAACLAVALFTLEPTILAHGRVLKDIDVAFAYLLFFYALYLYGSAANLRRAIFLGLACGLALTVKYSMLIVFPILLIFGCGLMFFPPDGVRRKRIAFEIVIAAIVAIVALNAAYLFRHQPLSIPDFQLAQRAPAHSQAVSSLLRFGKVIVPPYFLLGALVTLQHNEGGQSAFLLGQYSDHGWWYYFPVTFALKTTIPFLVVTIASLVWAIRRISHRDMKFLLIVIPMLLYAMFAMLASINIGIRHFLPVFPFLFILGGALLNQLLNVRKYRPLALASVIIVLALCGVEGIRAYPNYIPYMNQLASSRPHWMYLSDSNIEWGDDAGALAEYLKAKGQTRVRAAFLGGSLTLPLYDVEYVDLLSPPEIHLDDTCYVAVGASYLNGSTVPGWGPGSGRETPAQQHNYFARYRDRKPEAVFGDSIYLFREREDSACH